MADEPSDSRRFGLTLLVAIWAMAFVYAFVAAAMAEPPDGGSLALGRARAYLGWQGLAGLLAIAVLGVGRRWPKGSSVRRLSLVPLAIAIFHAVAIGGVLLWAKGR